MTQARETIIQMLKAQIQERRDAAQDIRKCAFSLSLDMRLCLYTMFRSNGHACCVCRTIDDSRKAVELVHAELHETTGDDAGRTDADDVKMEDAESGDGSARNHALENGVMTPTGAHAEQSAVRLLPVLLSMLSLDY